MPRNAAAPDPERQLMIKTKACQRLVKEVNYYKKEVKENETKLAAMKDEERDPYDIKKFEEVLGESYMMVPDSENRLKKSLEELSQVLKSEDVQAIVMGGGDNEWVKTANELLKEHQVTSTSTNGGKGEEESEKEAIIEETDVSELKDDEAF